MFDFLSKLFSSRTKDLPPVKSSQLKTSAKVQSGLQAPSTQTEINSVSHAAQNRKVQEQQERAKVLANIAERARQTPIDEVGMLQILLACDFADGRYQAALLIQSQPALEQIKAAFRNTDKRVVKLVQGRLDQLAHLQKQQQLAEKCLEQAQQLIQQSQLLSNQVTSLDKQKAQISDFPESLLESFTELRNALESRLLAQTALQRKVLDLSNAMSAWVTADHPMQDGWELQLNLWQQEYEQSQSATEVSALPKGLLHNCLQQLDALKQKFQTFQELEQRHAARLQQEQEHIERLKQQAIKLETASDAVSEAAIDALADSKHDAEQLSLAKDGVTSEQSDAGTATIDSQATADSKGQANKETQATKETKESRIKLPVSEILSLIEALEQAIEQGSIQTAGKLDKQLRGVEIRFSGLSAAQKDRLLQARSELVYLQGWAKWGGDVSRDELIKAAEDLTAVALAPNELAKKVAALRMRWKEMEVSSGAATQTLWQRFDAACNNAYAPAAEYFRLQAEQRKVNLEQAQSLLEKIQQDALNLRQASELNPDWKAVAQFCMQAQSAWKNLGHLERKEKTRLEVEFNSLLQAWQTALDERRKEEIGLRHQLIAEVAQLDPRQKTSTEQLRSLQERWQVQASSIPLRRRDEQEVWEKFRAACDHFFAQRKLASGEADKFRKDNFEAKSGLCLQLEQAFSTVSSEHSISQLLTQVAHDWKQISFVPRSEEDALEQRYAKAQQDLTLKLHQMQQAQTQNIKQLCLSKLQLCQSVEALLSENLEKNETGQDPQLVQLTNNWAQLDSLPGKLNVVLNQRFSDAVKAFENLDHAYRLMLDENLHSLDAALLQQEIIAGISSPAELSRERLQMQVDVLQNSLKRGNASESQTDILYKIIGMPVRLDLARAQRVEHIVTLNEAW